MLLFDFHIPFILIQYLPKLFFFFFHLNIRGIIMGKGVNYFWHTLAKVLKQKVSIKIYT